MKPFSFSVEHHLRGFEPWLAPRMPLKKHPRSLGYSATRYKIISLLKLHKCLKNPIIQYNNLKYTRVLKIKNSKKRYLLSCIWFFHSSKLICYHDVILYIELFEYVFNLKKFWRLKYGPTIIRSLYFTYFMSWFCKNKFNRILWD